MNNNDNAMNKKARLTDIWNEMKTRCNNTNDPNYEQYGKKGIVVCNEWKESFESFYIWALNNAYSNNSVIDRIHIDGGYEPSNCRWVTMAGTICKDS